MQALGIPSTRALSVVATGEPVYRERVLPGAVLTRVAASHLRVGTFEFLSSRGDGKGLRRLADHAIARHDPDLQGAPDRDLALLRRVVARQAGLIAQWMNVGFIHGVMNTDNMAISGETIDYGPCAFLEAYDPDTVFSSIDERGRYAYGNQPGIARWNLARLAESLLPLIVADPSEASFARAWRGPPRCWTPFRPCTRPLCCKASVPNWACSRRAPRTRPRTANWRTTGWLCWRASRSTSRWRGVVWRTPPKAGRAACWPCYHRLPIERLRLPRSHRG